MYLPFFNLISVISLLLAYSIALLIPFKLILAFILFSPHFIPKYSLFIVPSSPIGFPYNFISIYSVFNNFLEYKVINNITKQTITVQNIIFFVFFIINSSFNIYFFFIFFRIDFTKLQ